MAGDVWRNLDGLGRLAARRFAGCFCSSGGLGSSSAPCTLGNTNLNDVLSQTLLLFR